MNTYEKIIEEIGSPQQLAVLLKKSYPSIMYKRSNGFKYNEAVAIEKETDGRITVAEIMAYRGTE